MSTDTNHVASDSLAILRDGDAICFEPVYLDADNATLVKTGGAWRAVGELKNFERYEKRPTKKSVQHGNWR